MGQNSFWAFVVRFEATGFAVANMVVERNRGVAAPFWILVALLAGLARRGLRAVSVSGLLAAGGSRSG